MTFPMPARPASFEIRGGWVVGQLIKDFALTPEQAAGIVGNLGYESAGFETLQEIGQAAPLGGYGWAQWTGPRRSTFEAWCADRALNVASDEANYGFLLAELKGTHAHDIEQLKKTTALDSAVFTFGVQFEAPGGTTATFLPGNADRLVYAQRALSGYHAVVPGPIPVVVPPPIPSPPTPPPDMVTVTMPRSVAVLVSQLLHDHIADVEQAISDLIGSAKA